MPLIRRKKASENDNDQASISSDDNSKKKKSVSTKKVKTGEKSNKWSCVDSCCWFVGCICTVWWSLLFLYNAMPASFPQYVTEAITGPLPDPPGVELLKEGLRAKHPVVFVPGIVTAGLELWEGHQCAEGLFRKRLWGGTFGEVYKRPLCWMEHMSLDNETGLDPPAEAKDIAVARSIAPGVLDKDLFGLQTLQHAMKMTRTWDSTMSMIPKGGETIWGGLDWSPEEGYVPSQRKQRNSDNSGSNQNGTESMNCQSKAVKYGRIISFGKDVAEAHSSEISKIDFRGAVKGNNVANTTCRDVWTEYHDMGIAGIKAVAEYKAYTAGDIVDLLHFVGPKMMARGSAHFSYGISEDLDDPKYRHYKYWSNPLETKLPNAPDMEIFSMYGVGIPTERAYVYRLSPSAECYIPFQIDTSANGGDEDSCLKDGVFSVDGDETVPVLSAGFMCAKGWRGKTRFNPSGIQTYVREYDHAPPSNLLLEGRGTQSGAHVDIMGNFALIEDIIRVAAGATGEDLGGDQVYTDIFKWSEKINLSL
ncbi:phospholipid:diacylglycerol acyltransferase [Actinidia rufa]|uniref:Phospholipid:diacylglycerol acyltransferase n=1 Tax=Actinidia rufa TaxID=165716 RepID=A0A7J0GBF1_9ERIC|nr:phospholipid:diacylglycerol acyltransferase [Actinidia rufa]